MGHARRNVPVKLGHVRHISFITGEIFANSDRFVNPNSGCRVAGEDLARAVTPAQGPPDQRA